MEVGQSPPGNGASRSEEAPWRHGSSATRTWPRSTPWPNSGAKSSSAAPSASKAPASTSTWTPRSRSPSPPPLASPPAPWRRPPNSRLATSTPNFPAPPADGSVLLPWRADPSWSAAASSSTRSPPATAPPAGGIFSPQRPLLRLDSHGYSPAILFKIVQAGGQLKSFALAATMMDLLAEVPISPRHLGRLTEEIGAELQHARDQRGQDWLHHRRPKLTRAAPQAVAVAVDGGCIQTRAPGQGPGVHEQGWKENKVACLHTLQGPTFAQDPHPQPPACFLDPQYVDELVQELKAHKRLGEDPEE